MTANSIAIWSIEFIYVVILFSVWSGHHSTQVKNQKIQKQVWWKASLFSYILGRPFPRPLSNQCSFWLIWTDTLAEILFYLDALSHDLKDQSKSLGPPGEMAT